MQNTQIKSKNVTRRTAVLKGLLTFIKNQGIKKQFVKVKGQKIWCSKVGVF